MDKNKVAVILGIVCLVLTYAICVQIKTIESATKSVGSGITDNSGLRDEVLRWQGKYNDKYKELEQAEAKLEQVRQEAISGSKEDEEAEEIKRNNQMLGLTEVKGKGIIIKIDDNREEGKDALNVSDYIVHEEDILQIINELFNSGADAISINGQRIINTTPVLCDGNIIRINGKIIGVPIEIKAIGYPESLYFALTRPKGYLQIMADDGVIVHAKISEETITISKYEGVYNYEYLNRGEK